MKNPILPTGLFITLEGLEGSGKTTQSKLLKTWFEELGFEVVLVGEPGGTPYGQAARRLFLDHHRELTPQAEVGLLLTAKSQLLETVVGPAIRRGAVVICDRYTDTLFAYQHYAKGHSRKMMEKLIEAFDCQFTPDYTLLFCIDPETSVRRSLMRKNQGGEYTDLDAESVDFHDTVCTGLIEEIAKRPPGTWGLIPAELSIEETFNYAKQALQRWLKSGRLPFDASKVMTTQHG